MNKIIAAFLISLAVIGCGSSDTDNSGETDFESMFIADQDNTGSVDLDVHETMSVGEVNSFFVTVKDRNGVGVPSSSIQCAVEPGLSIIEPAPVPGGTGIAGGGVGLTGGDGRFSGKVGCTTAGSWRILCRSLGGNWEDHETIKCS